MMGRQLNVRDVPESIHDWIERERHARMESKQNFLLGVLEHAYAGAVSEDTPLFPDLSEPAGEITPPVVRSAPFTFIDLFAGIGGFRIALQRLGGHCLFTSEWDKYSKKTYASWFGEEPVGDLRAVDPKDIPNHDVLAAGFPCQPFSIAGVSKKNSLGREHGFKDESQGNLFFVLAAIIEAKRPPALLLENVKNLLSHDRGQTWRVIRETLEALGYAIHAKVIDAADYVPQHRERVFIVGFDREVFGDDLAFSWPEPPDGAGPVLRDVLDSVVSEKYTLSDHLWDYLQKYAERHRKKGNGFGFGMADLDGITRTLSARYHKDGSEILIPQGKPLNPRRLTPLECRRLMGFPDELEIVVSDTQAYRQFGNAVCPPVVEAVGQRILQVICDHLRRSRVNLIKGRRIA